MLAVASMGITAVNAATFVWDNTSTDGEYTTDGNWDTPGTPSSTDQVTINNGDTVNFTPGGDHNIATGGSMSVANGSRWQTSAGNWSQIDGTLTLDNGTYIRTAGGVADFGARTTGGITTVSMANGSLLEASDIRFGNKNFGSTASTNNIFLTGGSSLVARGNELWFGDPAATAGTYNVNMTINNGSITALGGGGASWFLWGSTNGGGTIGGATPVGDNSYIVNFTGPGNITLGAAGLNIGTNGAAQSYLDLWNAGILQANGSNAGAFGDYFSVTGTPGTDNYILTSSVPEPSSAALLGLGGLALILCRRK